MARATARQAAMQLIFEKLLGGDGGEESIEMVYEELKLQDAQVEDTPNKEDKQYIARVLSGTMEHLDEIDAQIAAHSVDWTIERMAKVDSTILRLATYEILYGTKDVPGGVAINEAVEMARIYSEPASGRFINGVLGAILRDQEAQQV